MINSLRLSRKCLLMGVACGLGMIAVASSPARAGTLDIIISEGGTSFEILDNGPLDSNPAVNQIQGLATALIFPDFTIVGLNASTNNPGADNPTGAVLTVGGEIQRTTEGAAASLTVTVTDTDYTLPAGFKSLTSTGSTSYTNVTAGDGQTFTSWFNPSNSPFAKDVSSGPLSFSSTGIDLNSASGTTPPVPGGPDGTYGLTNETVITLSGVTGGVIPDVTFGGSTKVLASVIPEPTSLAIMLPALPVVIMGWLRQRKARAVSTN